MEKTFNPTDKIAVQNLFPWAVGFQVWSDRENKDIDLMIAGNELCKKLTYEQLENEIFRDNSAIVGTDRKGGHAMLRIVDDDAYKALFGEEKRSNQLSQDVLKKLFAIGDRKKFKKTLEEFVTTDGEKKFVAYYFANYINEDDINSFIIGDLEKHLGIKMFTPDTRQYTYGTD